MSRLLYEIWTVENPEIPEFPIRLQMKNYVACFPSEERAKAYMYAIQAINETKKF